MRIALVNDLGQGGGTERYLVELARALTARGHVTRLLTGTPCAEAREANGLFPILLESSPEDADLSSLLKACSDFHPDAILINNLASPSTLRALSTIAPSTVFLHAPAAFCPGGAKFWKTPGSICQIPYSPGCLWRAWSRRCAPRRPDAWLSNYLRTGDFLETLKVSRRIVVASNFMAEEAALAGIPRDRLAVLPLFVNALEAEPPPPTDRNILFVGRLVTEKGLHVLMEAIRLLPLRVPLRIVGDGPQRNTLVRHAKGLDINFLGWKSPVDVRQEISRATLLALPSLWPEPFGLVGLEAMAQGRPVVAFRVGGIPEWLDHARTGLLVPPNDVPALAHALKTLCEAPDDARRMGLTGWHTARERFTEQAHVDGLLSLLS